GVPQSCVSSPLLFTRYTNDCVSCVPDHHIIKFSDDTTLAALMKAGRSRPGTWTVSTDWSSGVITMVSFSIHLKQRRPSLRHPECPDCPAQHSQSGH
ncbi:hypothetical protein LDENG_00080180, partial [Lucifuga dentata]